MVAALLALALALPTAQPQWRVEVDAAGTYAVDYGAERDLVDGQASGEWRWQMKALASGAAIDTDLAIFRMTTGETSTVVLPDGEPFCRPPASRTVGWVRDARVGAYFDARRRGFEVDHPFGGLLTGCHVGSHGMTLYDGAGPAITRIPRGSFRPRRDRSFSRTWTQSIALDRSHDPGQDTHTFTATGTITIEASRISRRAARTLAVTGARLPVVAIGPQTEAEAREHGLDVAAVADAHDLDGLVEVIQSL